MNKLKLKLFVLLLLFLGQFVNFANAQEYGQNGELIFYQKIYPINSIDPTITSNSTGSYFPGLRGSNQMIIYTPLYGIRTNTNEFGTEAIVNGNTVTSLSGADSLIPPDGLVISGHGVAKTWMNNNLMVGAKVYVNKDAKTLTVYITSDTFLYGAREKIKEAQGIVEYYRSISYMYDYKKPCEYIEKAKEYLHQAEKNPQDVQKYSTMAIDAANKALANSLPFDQNELKGVWIRPTETSPEAIQASLDKIKSAGIDNVFLETYFHGKTIFPSETMQSYNFIPQNEKFAGFDPLKVWVNEAHKRNMKVHIWFETFYVGNDNPKNNPKSILSVRPEWGNKTKRDFDSLTAVPSLSEHGGYFIDPANPEVQQFLQCLICEIVNRYHPDGINLDYIRYPQSIAAKYSSYDLSNWGYTEYARNEFKLKYGKDPIDISYTDPLWMLWDKYRQDKVTAFVSRISKVARLRDIKLTTVIFPDRQKALETKQQDWRSWSALGYVDGFTPLLLTCDSKTASVMLQDVIKNKSTSTNLYAGLFITFMGGSNEDLLRQIHESRKLRVNGVIMFDYAHLANQYIETLATSAFDPTQLADASSNCKNQSPRFKQRRKIFRRG